MCGPLPFCFYAGTDGPGTHRNVFLDAARTLELLDEAAALNVKAITWTGGGDPSHHPQIGALLERANALGLEQGMFTHALTPLKYDPAHLSWVRITMTDKSAKPENIKKIRAGVKTLGIAFNYASEKDVPYLWETLHLAEDVMADYVQLRPALKFHGETVDIKPPDISHPLLHVTDYKFEEAKKKHPYKRCEGWHFIPLIWEDGNVDVCSYMRLHKGYTLGNIYEQSLRDIMDNAPKYVDVLDTCQVCCKLNEINQTIAVARTLRDVNFP